MGNTRTFGFALIILQVLLLCSGVNSMQKFPSTIGSLDNICYFQTPSKPNVTCGWFSSDEQLPWIHTDTPTDEELLAGLFTDYSPTSDGYFLVARSVDNNQTSTYLLSKNVHGGEGRIFTFSIHMSGTGGTITVEVGHIADTRGFREVYRLSDDLGKWWVQSSGIPIADCLDYQIRITAEIQEGVTTSIALDDFRFEDDPKVKPLQPAPGIPKDKLCWNGASYMLSVDRTTNHVCCCKPGFTGDFCQTNIDECVSNLCMNGATCMDQDNGYQCRCADDFEGTFCQLAIDDCEGVTCLHSGVCKDEVKDYHCECVEGYTGKNCETELDICKCRNGGTCIHRSTENAICSCPRGYSGDLCEVDISECTRRGNPCGEMATCLDGPGAEYMCFCPPGETTVVESGITKCEDTHDSCASQPCLYGGICKDTRLGFECQCVVGTEGYRCETNLDDCARVDCQNGGTCKDKINGYECKCKPEFAGTNCELDISDQICNENCETQKTEHCTFDEGRPICNCIKGFTGSKCQHRLQQCDSNPCVRGICTERPIGYSCGCQYGWTGHNCDKPVDFCLSFDCGEHGTCLNTNDGPRCKCDTEFTGSRCSRRINPCDTVYCEHGGKCVAIYEPFRPYKCECTSSQYVGKHCEIELVVPPPASAAQNQRAILQQTNGCTDFWTLPQELKGSILIVCVAVNVAILALGIVIIEICVRSARLKHKRHGLESSRRYNDSFSYPYPYRR